MDTKENILNELKEVSPLLYDLKTSNGQPFKIPADYFAALPENIFNSIESGLSEGIGKQSFKVPENYFNGLSSSILTAIEKEENSTTKDAARTPIVIELHQHRKRQKSSSFKIYAMAAAIAGLFIFMTFLNNSITKPNAVEVNFSEAEFDFLEEYDTEITNEASYSLIDLSNQSIDLSMTDEFVAELAVYFDEDMNENELNQLYHDI
jgi:hypothetical protein